MTVFYLHLWFFVYFNLNQESIWRVAQWVNPFMQNDEKWSNILVKTARFWKYVWPFFIIILERVKDYTRVWRLPVRTQSSVRLGFGNQTRYQASGELSGDMADHITSNFLKVVFHKSYLVHSWISLIRENIYILDQLTTVQYFSYCNLISALCGSKKS